MYKVNVADKYGLTVNEAAEYFGIGVNKIRDMIDKPECPYVLRVGNKRLIKRQLLEKYLDSQEVI